MARNHWPPSISSRSTGLIWQRQQNPIRNKKLGSQAPYLLAFFPWRAVASREGCFALARRSYFFRRLARFLALSLPLLCPIGLTFARVWRPSNGATGMSDMAGYAATVAVEPSGSERDTME